MVSDMIVLLELSLFVHWLLVYGLWAVDAVGGLGQGFTDRQCLFLLFIWPLVQGPCMFTDVVLSTAVVWMNDVKTDAYSTTLILQFVVRWPRRSCVKSDKCPQEKSLESVLVGADDYKIENLGVWSEKEVSLRVGGKKKKHGIKKTMYLLLLQRFWSFIKNKNKNCPKANNATGVQCLIGEVLFSDWGQSIQMSVLPDWDLITMQASPDVLWVIQ